MIVERAAIASRVFGCAHAHFDNHVSTLETVFGGATAIGFFDRPHEAGIGAGDRNERVEARQRDVIESKCVAGIPIDPGPGHEHATTAVSSSPLPTGPTEIAHSLSQPGNVV